MEIILSDPEAPDAQKLLGKLSTVLSALTGDSGRSSFDYEEARQPGAVFAVAYREGVPVACGGYRPAGENMAEIKRMYAEERTGSQLLAFLEAEARKAGIVALLLSTRVVNTRAIRFYQNHGYRRIENYGRYVGRSNSICMKKSIGKAETPGRQSLNRLV